MPRGNGDVIKTNVKRRVDLVLPFAALSTNKMYSGRKRRSVYYKFFRKKLFKYLDEKFKAPVKLTGNLSLSLEVGFSNSLSDLSNAIKSVEDVLAEYLGFNDKQIVQIELSKYLVHKGDEYMKVSIFKTRKNIDRRGNGKKTRE